jgi:hypothetical protein
LRRRAGRARRRLPCLAAFRLALRAAFGAPLFALLRAAGFRLLAALGAARLGLLLPGRVRLPLRPLLPRGLGRRLRRRAGGVGGQLRRHLLGRHRQRGQGSDQAGRGESKHRAHQAILRVRDAVLHDPALPSADGRMTPAMRLTRGPPRPNLSTKESCDRDDRWDRLHDRRAPPARRH